MKTDKGWNILYMIVYQTLKNVLIIYYTVIYFHKEIKNHDSQAKIFPSLHIGFIVVTKSNTLSVLSSLIHYYKSSKSYSLVRNDKIRI